MSLNDLRKTRWKTDAESITILPFGMFYLVSALFLIFFGVMAIMVMPMTGPGGTLVIAGVFIAIILIFAAAGATSVVFDAQQKVMQQKLFGVLTIKTIPFEDIHGISIVNSLGSYSFKLFRKNNKYGKGIAVSSGYAKDTDKNAIAFTQEVIPAVHAYLDMVPQPLDKKTVITSYEFFDVAPPEYTVKRSKIGIILIGLFIMAYPIAEVTGYADLIESSDIFKMLMVYAAIIFGIAVIESAFLKITFDTAAKAVNVTSPTGIRNKQYLFADFIDFQIVRRTTNGAYTGTDVQMYFRAGAKEKMVVLRGFRSTSKIEQFLDEVHQIMSEK